MASLFLTQKLRLTQKWKKFVKMGCIFGLMITAEEGKTEKSVRFFNQPAFVSSKLTTLMIGFPWHRCSIVFFSAAGLLSLSLSSTLHKLLRFASFLNVSIGSVQGRVNFLSNVALFNLEIIDCFSKKTVTAKFVLHSYERFFSVCGEKQLEILAAG